MNKSEMLRALKKQYLHISKEIIPKFDFIEEKIFF